MPDGVPPFPQVPWYQGSQPSNDVNGRFNSRFPGGPPNPGDGPGGGGGGGNVSNGGGDFYSGLRKFVDDKRSDLKLKPLPD